MARRKIREFDAKKLLVEKLTSHPYRGILVDQRTDLEQLPTLFPWLLEQKLVIKPDQLFGKRGKLGLVLVNATFNQIKLYLQEHLNKEISIGKATDTLTHFLIEPYTPHEKEFYLSIGGSPKHQEQNNRLDPRAGTNIFFSFHGGVDLEEHWHLVTSQWIATGTELTHENVESLLQMREQASQQPLSILEKEKLVSFIKKSYQFFLDLDFTYLEFNPFTFNTQGDLILLDAVAEVDSCAAFLHEKEWKALSFPREFGKKMYPEELFIAELDEKSGSSLKLTILNPRGRIWNILSGGGASLIFLDTIAAYRNSIEIANYGEYSGNPTPEESYLYAKTILGLMTRYPDPLGKILIIGGGIANFTDIEKTLSGIIKALQEYQQQLRQQKISIFVRRGGPNYEKGLRLMEQTGKDLHLFIKVYGPETPMVDIIPMALQHLHTPPSQ